MGFLMYAATNSPGLRIAMWSGPRNISTAMMRSWGSRPDTAVCDEPLYAHYLLRTGVDHPGAAEIIAHHETDWRAVVRWLTGPIPGGKAIFFQKHMSHHLLPDIDVHWVEGLANCFLIREPREVIVSLGKVIARPTLEQTGLPQQVDIFEHLCRRTGRTAPVVDSRDVLLDPRRVLSALCERLNVPFMEDMLSWPPGPRTTDGIWARHWYAEVDRSTGFGPYRPRNEPVADELQPLLEQCEPLYRRLHQQRIA
jgi:hypothetical protein